MRFYRSLRKIQYLKMTEPPLIIEVGDVIVDSFYHCFRTVIVATPNIGTRFLPYSVQIKPNELRLTEYFTPLTMEELDIIKPHLRKTLKPDYRISFNEDGLKKLTKYCCFKCGNSVFGTSPITKHNTIGRCYNCGTPDSELFISEKFKIDIFR